MARLMHINFWQGYIIERGGFYEKKNIAGRKGFYPD